MKVFEVKVKLFLLRDIHFDNLQFKTALFIDSSLSKNNDFLEFHKSNNFKNYCFGNLYPIEKEKIYKKGSIYTLIIRTIDPNLANHFNENLVNEFNDDFKALIAETRIIPKYHINKIYCLSSLILKTENGYWRNNLSIEEYEEKIKENLIKKYNSFYNKKIDNNFDLYTFIEFKNKKPIATKYKDIKFLGDKISLNISDSKIAQDLAYMSLGTGLNHINSRGYGFVGFKYQ